MSDGAALKIAGTTLALETHHLRCEVQVTRLASGRRRVQVSASGWEAPDLAAIDWDAPVAIGWLDPGGAGDAEVWLSISVLSPGPVYTSDVAGVLVQWSLAGVESELSSSAVTIAGTDYSAAISADPDPGQVQVMTDGSAALLQAWVRWTVRIEGEGPGPAVSAGEVAISSAVWSGTLLTAGVSRSWDPESGARRWTITGTGTAS